MKKVSLLHHTGSSVVALLLNLLIAFAVYFICRVAYLLENYSYFSEHLSFSYLLRMFGGSLMFDRSAIAYTHIPYIVMMLVPLYWKETYIYNKVAKGYFLVINTLTMVMNLCDAVYFPYTLRRTTTSVFREFGNENNLGGVFLHELISHWYLVVLAIVLVWAMHRLYVKPRMMRSEIVERKLKLRYTIVMLLSLIAAIPISVGAMRGGLGSGIRPITINNANQYVERPIDCALVLNTPFAMLRTIGKSVFAVPAYFASETEAAKVFTPIHQAGDSLQMTKKNVVIIIVESFGREYIGALNKELEGGKYKGYTPCVDELIGKSVTYKHSFCNGRKSIDGMPSVLCGIPMFVEPFVLTPASMNTYTGIAGLLGQEGYETAFFHGANRGSMGFLAFANKTGFQHYYGRQDYAADKRFGGDKDFDGNWGIWDEPFMQYYCTKMSEMREPFMTAVFTVSSHHPFEVPDQYKNTFKDEELEIHKCIRYTDMAIGKFFETAARQPWFNNTIFVLTSDHTNMSNHAEYSTDLGRFCSPIVIYDPSGSLQPGMRDAIAQQTDIVPTVLGMLNYPKPHLSFGCDLMQTPPEETFAVNYLNGVYQYVKYGYVLQFDGERTKAVYALDDRLMKNNLAGKVSVQQKMETEVKAIIWQYMFRMVNDRLMP